jgi:hypothetical protein
VGHGADDHFRVSQQCKTSRVSTWSEAAPVAAFTCFRADFLRPLSVIR